jgi:predicted ATPase
MLSEPTIQKKKVFVNRTIELAKLHTTLEAVEKGKGRVVLIEGEAGIGKTALVDKFLENVDGLRVERTECVYGESEPYAPIKRLMKEEEIETIKTEMPILGLMPVPGVSKTKKEKKAEDLSGDREKMFETFVGFIKKNSRKNPAIYVLDNLQWIDDASAKLIIRTLPRLESTKILLIMLYRKEDITKGSPAYELLSQSTMLEASTTIKLSRLGYSEVADLITRKLGRTDIPKSFINSIYKETEGNPLFVHELLNSLIQEGILDPTSYTSIEAKKIRVPPSIKEVLMRRIAKLSPEAKKVLNYAAIIGVRFDFETLRALTDMDEEQLLDAIDELLAAGIIMQ